MEIVPMLVEDFQIQAFRKRLVDEQKNLYYNALLAHDNQIIVEMYREAYQRIEAYTDLYISQLFMEFVMKEFYSTHLEFIDLFAGSSLDKGVL